MVRAASLLALAAPIALGCAPPEHVAAPVDVHLASPDSPVVGVSGVLARAAARAQVGSDAAFAALLARNDEDATMRAPAAMRRAMIALEIRALEISAYFERRDGALVLVWSASMRIDDERSARASIAASLEKSGFTSTGEAWSRGEERAIAQSSAESGPTTFELEWEITVLASVASVPARVVFDEAPWLREPRLDPSAVRALGERSVVAIVSGATPHAGRATNDEQEDRRRATEWSMDVEPAVDDEIPRAIAQLRDALVIGGFHVSGVEPATPVEEIELERPESSQAAWVLAARRQDVEGWVPRVVVASY